MATDTVKYLRTLHYSYLEAVLDYQLTEVCFCNSKLSTFKQLVKSLAVRGFLGPDIIPLFSALKMSYDIVKGLLYVLHRGDFGHEVGNGELHPIIDTG